MIKVLMVASGLHRNGTETFMMNVFRSIDRSRIMFDFLIYEPDENGYEQEAKELGANIYVYPPRNKNYFAYRRFLRRFFREHSKDYSAIHYNGNSFSDVLPIKLAKKHGIPLRILHSHNTTTFKLHNILLHKFHRKNAHKFANTFLACSSGAREWGFKNSRSFASSKVIPNGIDLETFRYDKDKREKIRGELGIDKHTFVVCNTGNFRPVKNHPFLIQVFEEIHNMRPDSVLLLCGAGGNINEIKRMVDEKNLTDAVKFIGIRKDVENILAASDAYVFPSLYEGLPFALIEAQASGIPVFAADTITNEIKLADNFEFLSLQSSPATWARRILTTVNERGLAKETERLKHYDIKETGRIMSEIYLQGNIPNL